MALFGAASYLPTYLQMVDGASAMESGLPMLPLMGGIVGASIISGQLISHTGHYRSYPIIGGALSAVGMWLLSRLEVDTPRLEYSIWMAVLGVGIGLVLPVLIVAVQNAVPPADLGIATSSDSFFRQIGGSVGAAVFGTLFAGRLADALGDRLPSDADLPDAGLPDPESLTPTVVHQLPDALRDGYVQAYADAMPRIFLYLVPVFLLGLLIAFFLKETPLLSSTTSHPISDAEPTVIPRARAAVQNAGAPVCGTVQHSDGSSVPRAALTLIDVTGRQIGRGGTGEDGRYALSTPGSGSYALIAAAGGHQPRAVSVTVGDRPVELDVVLGGAGRLATLAGSAPAFRPAALPVTVQSARETRQDVELAGGAVLRGTVRAGGARSVEDARVTLLDAGGHVVDTLTTGPDGTFRFVDLASGEYTVITAGYPPVATVLQVAGNGRTERDLQPGHED